MLSTVFVSTWTALKLQLNTHQVCSPLDDVTDLVICDAVDARRLSTQLLITQI